MTQNGFPKEDIDAYREKILKELGRKLPIGVQSFEKLRSSEFVYVDKTAYIYLVARAGVQFFLSRPRRFGKSLFLSTLRAYWEGKKELFKGLAIEKLEEGNSDAWQKYPVLYFDFNGKDYTKQGALERKLIFILEDWEEKYDCVPKREMGLEERFENVLKKACIKTGNPCVILVDEYYKPLLETVDNKELQEHNKAVFKGFFGVLKSYDEYIRSVFITGVTKFHKVSIFSDLNQLNDISLDRKFAGVCGITEEELKENFKPEIRAMSEHNNITEEECLKRLKKQYDGYHFNKEGEDVYNPFSLINAFFGKDFGSYWFSSGTPTFLAKHLKDIQFDPQSLTNKTIKIDSGTLMDYVSDNPDPIPLLYQTGYLTIVDYDSESREYVLAFPNEEVKYGMLRSLLPEYVYNCGSGSGVDIYTLRRFIQNGELEGIRKVLTALFARITYTSANATFEHYFQTVIYLVFTLLGQHTSCEVHTFTGRIDCKTETDKYVYLFEFKLDDSAENALKQIEEKGYTLPFAADSRKLYKVGVAFDSETRMLADWKVVE